MPGAAGAVPVGRYRVGNALPVPGVPGAPGTPERAMLFANVQFRMTAGSGHRSRSRRRGRRRCAAAVAAPALECRLRCCRRCRRCRRSRRRRRYPGTCSCQHRTAAAQAGEAPPWPLPVPSATEAAPLAVAGGLGSGSPPAADSAHVEGFGVVVLCPTAPCAAMATGRDAVGDHAVAEGRRAVVLAEDAAAERIADGVAAALRPAAAAESAIASADWLVGVGPETPVRARRHRGPRTSRCGSSRRRR